MVCVDPENPSERGAMWEGPFEERDTDPHHHHPIARAWALWESIREDWPGMQATVIANQRAKNLAAAARMESMGFDYDEALHDYENEGGVAGAAA